MGHGILLSLEEVFRLGSTSPLPSRYFTCKNGAGIACLRVLPRRRLPEQRRRMPSGHTPEGRMLACCSINTNCHCRHYQGHALSGKPLDEGNVPQHSSASSARTSKTCKTSSNQAGNKQDWPLPRVAKYRSGRTWLGCHEGVWQVISPWTSLLALSPAISLRPLHCQLLIRLHVIGCVVLCATEGVQCGSCRRAVLRGVMLHIWAAVVSFRQLPGVWTELKEVGNDVCQICVTQRCHRRLSHYRWQVAGAWLCCCDRRKLECWRHVVPVVVCCTVQVAATCVHAARLLGCYCCLERRALTVQLHGTWAAGVVLTALHCCWRWEVRLLPLTGCSCGGMVTLTGGT